MHNSNGQESLNDASRPNSPYHILGLKSPEAHHVHMYGSLTQLHGVAKVGSSLYSHSSTVLLLKPRIKHLWGKSWQQGMGSHIKNP